jgi:Fur family transcriptional regulator, ferric uptake regulator
MELADFRRLLKSCGMKTTPCRLKLFNLFTTHNHALSQTEIEHNLRPNMDRVTLYRTLKGFEENGIIHRVAGLDGSANFALTTVDANNQPNHPTQHLHFCCMECKNIYCLDDPEMPAITLPDTYIVHALKMTVVGICNKCNPNNSQQD